MRGALAFLTVIGGARAPNKRTPAWFPVVGAGLGAAVATAHWGAHRLWPVLIAGAVVMTIDLVLTGALHLDGLADTADGLLPHMEQNRRLEVMAEPGVGAFAITAVTGALAVRWAVLADPDIRPVDLTAVWAGSRTIAATVPAMVPYVRPDGLASPFVEGASCWIALWLLPISMLMIVGGGWSGVAAATAAPIAAAAVLWLAWRRIGGFTGDVLGTVIVISETAALLALTTEL